MGQQGKRKGRGVSASSAVRPAPVLQCSHGGCDEENVDQRGR